MSRDWPTVRCGVDNSFPGRPGRWLRPPPGNRGSRTHGARPVPARQSGCRREPASRSGSRGSDGSSWRGSVAEADRFAGLQILLFLQAPGLAAFLAEQLDETTALDGVVLHHALVATLALRLQDDAPVLFFLGRRNHVQLQLRRVAVAVELQPRQTGLVIERERGFEVQLARQLFTLQRGIDALADVIVVVHHHAHRVLDGDYQQTGAEDHRHGKDTDDEPGPELLVPATFGLRLHASPFALTDDGT